MSNQKATNTLALIDDLHTEVAPLLAENNQSWDRLRTTLRIAVEQNPDILKCSPRSIRREVMKCASDGLVPDNKQATLVAYKGELQYQPMVHGIIKRMKELGGVFSIVCNLVYEKDSFDYNEADPDSLVHRSDPFAKDRGTIVGGYVIFRDEGKRLIHLEVMSMSDFERVRKASKAPNSPAWRDWLPEMCKKAVLRRGSKYISINNDKIRTLIERQDELFDLSSTNTPRERIDPFSGPTIDQQCGNAPMIENNSNGEGDTKRPENKKNKGQNDGKAHSEQKAPTKNQQKKQGGEKSPSQELVKPSFPDVDIDPANQEVVKHMAETVFSIALKDGMPPEARREELKKVAPAWKAELPEQTHLVLKFVIDATDWCIKSDAADGEWWADLVIFTKYVAEAIAVDKLELK